MDELSLDMVEDLNRGNRRNGWKYWLFYSELERKLDGIIDSNITEIKYEGKEIDKDTMKYELSI
jgi:hypothetical protein